MDQSCGSEEESEDSLVFAVQGDAEDSDLDRAPPSIISDARGKGDDSLDLPLQGDAEDSDSDSAPPSMMSDKSGGSRASSFVDLTNPLYKVPTP